MQSESKALRNEQREIRLGKLEAMRAEGQDPFKITLADQAQHCAEIAENFESFENKDVSVCGRMMSKRRKGKVSFIDIRDRSGRLQVYVRYDEVGEDVYESFKNGTSATSSRSRASCSRRTWARRPFTHARSVC